MSWRDDAACRGLDTNWFFPERGEITEQAVAVCALCPSRLPCLTYALDNLIREGVWGGLSENQRRRLRKGRPRTVTCAHCFQRYVFVPSGPRSRSLYCSDGCAHAHRLALKRDSHRRAEQDRKAHARRERHRTTGDVTIDSLGDDAA